MFAFYADNHLANHPGWENEMELRGETDGEVAVSTVFRRRHTHYDDPVEGSMTVTEFERDDSFGFTIDDGLGEFYGRMTFEAASDSATRVTASADVPGMPEAGDSSLVRSIMERWLNTENLIRPSEPPDRLRGRRPLT